MMDLSAQKTMIKTAALKDSENEICGVILKNGSTKQCENISKRKDVHYLIHPKELSGFENNIYCTFHSHTKTDSSPSREDELIAEKLKLPCLIYSIQDDKFSFYEPTGERIPLLNRPFILGTLDCIELIKDYYSEMLNIELKDTSFFDKRLIEYQDMEASIYNNYNDKDLMIEYFQALGFVKVNDLRKNDIVFLKEKKVIPACHVMVYTGDGNFLSQSHLSHSRSLKRLIYSKKIQKKALAIMRYER